MTPAAVLALVLSASAYLGAHPAARVVAAIVGAVARERSPVLGSAREDAISLLVYCDGETGCVENARAGDLGKARGSWQIQGGCGSRPLDEQAECWLAIADWSVKACRKLPEAERLAALASGSCARGHVVSRERHARVLAALMATSPSDGELGRDYPTDSGSDAESWSLAE